MQAKQSGFTYLMLLWWVAISGVVLAALGQQWMLDSRRERETEMAFRAEQIKQAIEAYHGASPVDSAAWPQRMDDLLEDRRGPALKRHLRQKWTDPLTPQGRWGELRSDGRLRGVYSLAKGSPLRAPLAIKSYQAWRFEASAGPSAAMASSAASVPLAP